MIPRSVRNNLPAHTLPFPGNFFFLTRPLPCRPLISWQADDDITIPLVCIAKSDFAKFFNTMRGVKMDSFVFGPQNKNAARALEEQAKDTRKKKTEKGKRKKKGGGCCAARPKNSR